MSDLKVYFYCNSHDLPPHKASYHHAFVGLAEGLLDIGAQVYGNRNYWQQNIPAQGETPRYLINHSPDVKPDDCDVVVTDSEWLYHNQELPHGITKRKRKYVLIHIDITFGILTSGFKKEFRKYDVILKGHFNAHVKGYPTNFSSWAFAGNERMRRATSEEILWNERTNTIVSNFRCLHQIRVKIQNDIYPLIADNDKKRFTFDNTIDDFDTVPSSDLDSLYWKQTGRRHNPAYYKRLIHSKITACFGGFFQYRRVSACKGFLQSPLVEKFQSSWKLKAAMKYISSKMPEKYLALFQWDSYRLWEAFLAGSLVFHVDFDKYGIDIPTMPKNGVHYLGLDFDNVTDVIQRICDDDPTLGKIAQAGKSWVVEHYTGRGLARQFLNRINIPYPS